MIGRLSSGAGVPPFGSKQATLRVSTCGHRPLRSTNINKRATCASGQPARPPRGTCGRSYGQVAAT